VTAADKRIRNQFETAAMLPLERHKQLAKRGQRAKELFSFSFCCVRLGLVLYVSFTFDSVLEAIED